MKRLTALILCLLVLGSCALAGQDLPYSGYALTPYGTYAPTPNGYEVEQALDLAHAGTVSLKKPEDLYVQKATGLVYIADTGNQRIVVLDSELRFVREYTGCGEYAFVTPRGVFADTQGNTYVADDGLSLVLKFSQDGTLVQEYARPVSELYDASTPYTPQKVVADSAGRVYVLSQGVYQGLIRFNKDGTFLNFFGANHVEVTLKVQMQKMLRVFMTRAQRSAMEAFIPIEYSNIDIDEKDMLYASVGTLEAKEMTSNSLYVLNPLGVPYRKFQAGSLADTLCDEDGFYTSLNRDTKEIIEYSQVTKGIMMTCGGNGTQMGLFKDPVALGKLDGKLLVLDRGTGFITVFSQTAFGKMVHDAVRMTTDGRYMEAIQLYTDILRMNQNSTLAYRGLGKAYYEMEDYEQAMKYYRLAQDREGYSNAFKEHSTSIIRKYMGWILAAVVLIAAALQARVIYRRRHGTPQRDPARALKPWRHPFHCMLHPYTGFEDIKLQGQGSMAASLVILAALALTSIISYVLTGFIFNPNQIEKLNAPLLIAGTLGVAALAYIAMLAVSSLMNDCEGKPRELLIVLSYSLLPMILSQLFLAVISNFVSADMQSFMDLIQLFGFLWSAVLLVVGSMQINQLTLKQTFLYLLLVVLAMAIVLVLLVLLYSLVQQFVVFLQTLYNEIMYRI